MILGHVEFDLVQRFGSSECRKIAIQFNSILSFEDRMQVEGGTDNPACIVMYAMPGMQVPQEAHVQGTYQDIYKKLHDRARELTLQDVESQVDAQIFGQMYARDKAAGKIAVPSGGLQLGR